METDVFGSVIESKQERNPSEYISEIITEIKEKEDVSGISDEAMLERATKIREERIKLREANAPKPLSPEEIKKKSEEEFDNEIKDLKENPIEWTLEEIQKEFETFPSLRMVYFNVAVNQPTMNLMIRVSLGYEEEFKSQIGKQLKKLRRMGLVKELLICEAWWKNHFNQKEGTGLKLTEDEADMLKKLSLKEDTDERKRNVLLGNSGFWFLTKSGKEMLPALKSVCSMSKSKKTLLL